MLTHPDHGGGGCEPFCCITNKSQKEQFAEAPFGPAIGEVLVCQRHHERTERRIVVNHGHDRSVLDPPLLLNFATKSRDSFVIKRTQPLQREDIPTLSFCLMAAGEPAAIELRLVAILAEFSSHDEAFLRRTLILDGLPLFRYQSGRGGDLYDDEVVAETIGAAGKNEFVSVEQMQRSVLALLYQQSPSAREYRSGHGVIERLPEAE